MQIFIQKILYDICLLFVSFCFVGETNKQILIDIGKRLRIRREELSFSQRDISQMTGLTVNTISAIENSGKATLNSFLLVCRALKTQPKAIFSTDIPLDTLYDLPPESRKKMEITRKLDELVFSSDFFDKPRRVSEVIRELGVDPAVSNRFSVYLTSYCKEGSLEFLREGNIKRYKKKSR